ncbi:recombinase family protein [Anoxybacillus sp. TBDG-1]
MPIYGYARTSTEHQNLQGQINELKAYGCYKIFKEQVSGATAERKELKKLLSTVQKGDKIVITKLDRLFRSTKHMLNTIDELKEKGVGLVVLNMGGDTIDTTTAIGKLMITMLSGFAEFERELMLERQKVGIADAKKRGVYKGRPTKYTEKNPKLQHALELFAKRDENGYTVKHILEITGIGRGTLYRKAKEHGLI